MYPLMKGDYCIWQGYHGSNPKPPSNQCVEPWDFITIFSPPFGKIVDIMLIHSGKLTNSNGTWTRIESRYFLSKLCFFALPC